MLPRPIVAVCTGLVLWPACAPPGPGAPPGPAVDAAGLVQLQEQSTRLEAPTRVIFDWTINEAGARFQGRGVARMEPEYKARLDLFLANGEAVVSAALVQDDLRLPGAAPPGLIPPAPLLWASLGVFRPGAEAELLGGEDAGAGRIRVRYRLPQGSELHYELSDGRIRTATLLAGGEVTEAMELTSPEEHRSLPAAARYRNIAAFRELQVEADRVDRVESFPLEIWTLEG